MTPSSTRSRFEQEIDHNSNVPLHAQLEQVLRRMILQPQYQNGECLPDELTLARQFSVSRSTVREAIKKLVFEGLVERRRGVGTRVVPILVKASVVAWPSFTREMNAKGIEVRDFSRELNDAEADETVARALGIEPGTRVKHLEGLRGVDDEPVIIYRSWFHPRLGDLAELDLKQSLYDALAATTQVIAVKADEKLRATLADEAVAARLRVPVGSAILVRERIVRDAGGQPIEYAFNHIRGDRYTYAISIERTRGG